MKCRYCGKEIDDGSLFCGYCGKEQPKVITCIKCGKELGAGDLFCGYCGAKQVVAEEGVGKNTVVAVTEPLVKDVIKPTDTDITKEVIKETTENVDAGEPKANVIQTPDVTMENKPDVVADGKESQLKEIKLPEVEKASSLAETNQEASCSDDTYTDDSRKKSFSFIAILIGVFGVIGLSCYLGLKGTGSNGSQNYISDSTMTDSVLPKEDTFNAEAIEKEVLKELESIKATGESRFLIINQNYTAQGTNIDTGEHLTNEFEKGTSLKWNDDITATEGGYNLKDYTGCELYFLPQNVVDEIKYKTASLSPSILDKATLVFESNSGETMRLCRAKSQNHRIKYNYNDEDMKGNVYLLCLGGSGFLLDFGNSEDFASTYFEGKIDDDGNLESDVCIMECDASASVCYVPSKKGLLYNGVLCKLKQCRPYKN